MYFEEGRPVRVEQQLAGRDCIGLRQWVDADGNVLAEEKDTNVDCQYDTWNYYEAGRLVRQGRARKGKGRADLLSHFDSGGRVQIQELVTSGGRRPDKKLFLSTDGQVSKHCADADGDGSIEMELVFEGSSLREALIDSDHDGVVDQREIYEKGQRIRLDADTNGDRRPDVVQYFEGGKLSRQDEDVDFDGSVDQRFFGSNRASVAEREEVPSAFEELGCGQFHAFWKKR